MYLIVDPGGPWTLIPHTKHLPQRVEGTVHPRFLWRVERSRCFASSQIEIQVGVETSAGCVHGPLLNSLRGSESRTGKTIPLRNLNIPCAYGPNKLKTPSNWTKNARPIHDFCRSRHIANAPIVISRVPTLRDPLNKKCCMSFAPTSNVHPVKSITFANSIPDLFIHIPTKGKGFKTARRKNDPNPTHMYPKSRCQFSEKTSSSVEANILVKLKL